MQKIAEQIHPATWWFLGAAFALISGSASGLLIPGIVIALSVILILSFRQNATWARSLRFYLLIAGAVILIRLLFRILFSYSGASAEIALALPKFVINLGFGSIEFLGPISFDAIGGAFVDGLRLAAIILSVAMSTTLANPRKLLKSAPGALFEIATSVSVAINLAPQLIESFQRVKRARELRGKSKRTAKLAGIVIPVLEDTLDRSLSLAASMDARGFGRKGNQSKGELLFARLIALVGLLATLFGIFFLLSGFNYFAAFALILLGIAFGVVNIRITSRRKVRTNLVSQKRTWLDYLISCALVILVLVNFAGWLN